MDKTFDDLKRLAKLFKKADLPSDMRVDEDYLDYGHDVITRPSITGLHRVYLTKANEIDCTTDAARFFCEVSNQMPAILSLIESYEQLQSKLDKACAALEFYTSRAVYERLQPDGDLIYCNEIAEQALAEIRKKDE